MSKIVSYNDLAQHNAPDDIWIIVNGRVYDMTDFAPQHPGGSDSELF